MDYQKIYDQIIKRAKSVDRKKDDGTYYEEHHIVMCSMGGSNESSNKVLLTAREHFIAHRLLWKIHKNRQTAFAFFLMCNLKTKNQERSIASSTAYEEARIAYTQKISGEGNPFFGKKHTEKSLKKIRAWSLNYKHTQATKAKIGRSLKGKRNGCKKVYQYDASFNLINTWDSLIKVYKHYPHLSPSVLGRVVRHNTQNPKELEIFSNFIITYKPIN